MDHTNKESLNKMAEDLAYRANRAYEQANPGPEQYQQGLGGSIGDTETGRCVRTPLYDRIRGRWAREIETSNNASLRAIQYQELVALLDKNPDTARILDLMEALRECRGLL